AEEYCRRSSRKINIYDLCHYKYKLFCYLSDFRVIIKRTKHCSISFGRHGSISVITYTLNIECVIFFISFDNEENYDNLLEYLLKSIEAPRIHHLFPYPTLSS